jgi:hypothetical protein
LILFLGEKTFAELILDDQEALRSPCGFGQKPFFIVMMVEHIGENDRPKILSPKAFFCPHNR